MRLSGPRLTAVLVVGVVIVLAGGGTLALWIGRSNLQTAGHPGVSSAEPATVVSSVPVMSGSTSVDGPPPAEPGSTEGSIDRSGSPIAVPVSSQVPAVDPTEAAPEPTTTSAAASSPATVAGTKLSPVPPSNNQTVQIAPALAGQPEATKIQQAVQRYFDSINQHDYKAWTQAVTSKAVSAQSEAAWQAAYASTTDSAIELQAINTDPLTATVRFTSTQELGLAPQDLQSTCITWTLTYRLEQGKDHHLIGSTLPDSVFKVSCA